MHFGKSCIKYIFLLLLYLIYEQKKKFVDIHNKMCIWRFCFKKNGDIYKWRYEVLLIWLNSNMLSQWQKNKLDSLTWSLFDDAKLFSTE